MTRSGRRGVTREAHLDLTVSLILAGAGSSGRTTAIARMGPGALSTSLSLAHILHAYINIRGYLVPLPNKCQQETFRYQEMQALRKLTTHWGMRARNFEASPKSGARTTER